VVNYAIQTVDNGTPNCPCFEDEPLLGADANGIYLSGNEFSFSGEFIGAQIFAVNKADLLAGAPQAGITLFSNLVIAGNPAATIQPALPAGSIFESANGGTEYFLSSLDALYLGDNRIAVWALINTCGLVSALGPPACASVPALSSVILTGLRYAVPPVARQRSGPFPLGVASRGHLETLDTDDDRMQQVVFANGLLYSALTTKLRVGGQAHSGLLYFIIQPDTAWRDWRRRQRCYHRKRLRCPSRPGSFLSVSGGNHGRGGGNDVLTLGGGQISQRWLRPDYVGLRSDEDSYRGRRCGSGRRILRLSPGRGRPGALG
jgi:hypothetical protein